MASFNPQDDGFDEPPPRPTHPPFAGGSWWCYRCSAWRPSRSTACPTLPTESVTGGRRGEPGRIRGPGETRPGGDRQSASALFRMATTAVSPAVVNVQSFRLRRGGEGFAGLPLGGNRMTPGFQSSELGSGVIIDKAKGYVVTNNHVIKDADRIMVRLGPGEDVRARLVGADPKSDLAVLQIKADLSVQAEWGDSDSSISATGCWPSAARSASTIQ